ncbi:CobW family GTP-binding protein [Butyricicoccus porcorum]|uniref:Cobalamin biosynthesis protein CobW n=1 Tax=Butyricicoccus porcorum TaxID=1945634 RepID=A0A252F7Y8_9FIRM|nr:GTP-binding protein [Butyricicoccus porcorum]MDY4484258.1 GTP-binding protein [Butyricicoccus porcorum]OUM21887.1 cobalamin biosynthesis protein CobW [Butyricicoccus porcorum]
MTKIDIISGFLGAGKTTLIRKLLEGPLKGKKVVLIENEFGEIGIDGGFLKDAGIEITEMNSGCICCTLVGDFGKALHDVLEQFTPDRIIIEPSGVGKLSDVAAAVQPVLKEGEVEMGCLTTVCDASKCRMYIKNFGEFYNNQLESAGTIVLSRTQNISEKRLDEALKLIREHAGEHTSIITTPWDELTGEQIYDVMCADGHQALLDAAELYAHEEHHHHHHDHEHHHHDHEEHEHHHAHDEHCGCGHDHEHDHEHHHHDHDEHEHHHEHHYDENGVCSCGHHHHDHDADEVFTSWGMETAHKYTEDDLRARLEQLGDTELFGMVLRAKGIVPAQDGGWLHFDMVPEEIELRRGSADYTGRLCVIGSGIKEDALAELFA